MPSINRPNSMNISQKINFNERGRKEHDRTHSKVGNTACAIKTDSFPPRYFLIKLYSFTVLLAPCPEEETFLLYSRQCLHIPFLSSQFEGHHFYCQIAKLILLNIIQSKWYGWILLKRTWCNILRIRFYIIQYVFSGRISDNFNS